MTGPPFVGARQGSKEQSPDRPLAQPPRYKSACESCHSSKVKCNGKHPCARCASNGWDCVYKLASRIGKPKGSRNKSTLRRLQLEAEQAERESASKSVSTTSTRSSPLPPTPVIAGTGPTSLGLAAIDHPKASPSILGGYPEWSWPSDPDFWAPTTDTATSLAPAADPAGLTTSVNPLFGFEDPIVSYEGLTSSADSIQSHVATQHDFGPLGRGSTSDQEPLGSDSLSYLGPEDSYEFPQWSPSLPVESYSGGTPSPARTWLSPEATAGLDYGDPHWTAEPCACVRNLSWHLGRADQLRQALTINTTLRAFMYEANESIQSIRSFLKCSVCDKDSTGLSLMVTMFTNINHLFTLTLSQSLDPLALYMRDPTYATSSVDIERLSSEENMARGLIGRWLRTCEHALSLVHSLRRRNSSHSEAGPSGLNADQAEPLDVGKVALWGMPELASFGEMLWRVKQNLSGYA